MSYDVRIGDFDRNYTSNLYRMFHQHIVNEKGETGLQSLYGKTGREVAPILAKAFDTLNRERYSDEHLSKYDAPNGWGTAVGGILFLAEIATACAMYPDETLIVHA